MSDFLVSSPNNSEAMHFRIFVLIIFYKVLPFFTYKSLALWFLRVKISCLVLYTLPRNMKLWNLVESNISKIIFFKNATDSPIDSPRILEEWITSWKGIQEWKKCTESRRKKEKVQGIIFKNRIKDMLSNRFYTEESLNVVVSTKDPIISGCEVCNYSWHMATKNLFLFRSVVFWNHRHRPC